MNRILIIRPSAIGDIVMASPMIRVLRKAMPQAHIAWLADESVRGIMDHHPDLNEIIYWSKERWRRLAKSMRVADLISEVRGFSTYLKKRRFDLAIDAQGLLRSRLLARLSGAAVRIGLDSREPGRFLMTQIVSRGEDKRPMSSEYRQLMCALRLDPETFAPEIVLSQKDRDAAKFKLSALGISNRFVLICPFTTRPHKHWLPERWAEIANYLAAQFSLPVLMLGSVHDADAGHRIQTLTDSPIYDLIGQTTLAEAAAIVEQAALVIGVDTGMTHMGTAFKRPTIALFGATCPYQNTPSPDTVVLYVPQTCSPCKRKPTCNGRLDCMGAITVKQASLAAHNLLESNDRRHSHSAH
jgi:heptosyltransferase-1